jgi:hypothetical protein
MMTDLIDVGSVREIKDRREFVPMENGTIPLELLMIEFGTRGLPRMFLMILVVIVTRTKLWLNLSNIHIDRKCC